jgi:hypothetical protein
MDAMLRWRQDAADGLLPNNSNMRTNALLGQLLTTTCACSKALDD